MQETDIVHIVDTDGTLVSDNNEDKSIMINEQLIYPDKQNLPSKLQQIKNPTILNNSLDPLTGKYVKRLWANKKTKLERWKRDMIWEYYRYRTRWPVTEALRETFYKNVPIVTIVYFNDPVEHRIELTKEMIDAYKSIKKIKCNTNGKNPLNNKIAKTVWYVRKIKQGTKNKRVWNYKENGESTPIKDVLIKMWHSKTRDIVIFYKDNSKEEFSITEEMFNLLNV